MIVTDGSLLDQKEYNKNNHELYSIILYFIIVTKLWMHKVR